MRPMKTEKMLRLDCLKQAVAVCGPGKNAGQNVVTLAAEFYAFVNGPAEKEADDGYDDYEENVDPAVQDRLGNRRAYTLRDLRRGS
jgi:hypothetical protein